MLPPDADRSGRIEKEEFVRWWMNRSAGGVDLNGDGASEGVGSWWSVTCRRVVTACVVLVEACGIRDLLTLNLVSGLYVVGGGASGQTGPTLHMVLALALLC